MMKPWSPAILILTGATLLMAGCTLLPVGEATPVDSASPLATPAVTPAMDATPATTDGEETPAGAAGEEQTVPNADASLAGIPGDVLNSVLDDAAQRLGVPADALVVTHAEAVTWNDGALGCPEPGMMYTQALVDGYWIVVEAGGQSLDYRVPASGSFRICENPLPSSGVNP
jgi:hypothetical protein